MFKCPSCGKDCKNAVGLANHVKVHYDHDPNPRSPLLSRPLTNDEKAARLGGRGR